MPRRIIEIANPRRHGESCTSLTKAEEYIRRGRAYLLPDGRLKIGKPGDDVAVDARGTIFWNGARSRYVDGIDVAMFPPCCNVVFPKTGTLRAARRCQ